MLFTILAGEGVEAEPGGRPLRLAGSCPEEAVICGEQRSGEWNVRAWQCRAAFVQSFSQFPLGQSWGPRELLLSGFERQEQMNQPFLRLPNHSLALSYFHTWPGRGRRRKSLGIDIQSQQVECQVTGPSPSHKPLVSY